MSIITISENAQNYIASLLKEHPEYKGLRVSIEKGGCSGSKYLFDYVEEEPQGDEKITAGVITIYVASTALLNLFGSELDFRDTTFESGLVFKNPNEKGRCGCGESIAFDAYTHSK